MKDPKKLLDQFAQRMESLLLKEPDPQPLMLEILEAAESAELLDASGAIRRSSPSLFVMDLLTDNPTAMQWAGLAAEWLNPLAISDSAELIEKIRPA